MNGFWLAALVRGLLLLVPPFVLVALLVRPVSAPLHQWSGVAAALLLALVMYVAVSTVTRYRARRAGALSLAEQVEAARRADSEIAVSLRR